MVTQDSPTTHTFIHTFFLLTCCNILIFHCAFQIQGLSKRFEPWMVKHSWTCWLRGLCHNWNMTVLTLSISWMEPHATITVMLRISLTRHCHIDGSEEQSTMINIFYSGHRGNRTWHPVIFSCGDTLKTIPTNHHSAKVSVNCKIAFELRCKPLMGTC